MPGTEYIYKITLSGTEAAKAAKQFKKELETHLAQVKMEIKFDTYAVGANLKKSVAQAQKTSGSTLKAAMKQTAREFERDVGRLAPKTFMEPSVNFIEDAISRPSNVAIEKLNNLKGAVKELGESTKRMGVGVDEWAGMSASEQSFTALQAAQRRVWGVRGMGYQMESYGRSAMMTGGAALGGMAAAAREYVQYSEPLNKAARNLEMNAEMTEQLDESLRMMAGTVSLFSPEEQAQQLYLWAAATGEVISGQDDLSAALDRTNTVQKLALLGAVSQEQAVEAVTDVMAQYQMSVDDTEKIVATFVKVAAVSKAEVGDLAMAFTYAGARSHQANTSFEETASALQLLSAFGLRGSRAGRGIARLFENLIAPSQEAKKHMDALFESTFGRTDMLITAEGQFVGLSGAVTVLAEATEDLTEAARAEFVARITTQNAERVLIPLLNTETEARKRGISAIDAQQKILQGVKDESTKTFTSMIKDVQGYDVSTQSSLDTLDNYWTQFTESVDGQAKLMTASLKGSLLTIGKEATTVLLPVLKEVVGYVRDLATFVADHPWTIKAILGGAGLLVAVGALAMMIGKGLRVYADVTAIAMAKAMRDAANKNLAAALQMGVSSGVMDAASTKMAAAAAANVRASAAYGVGAFLGGAVKTAGSIIAPIVSGVSAAILPVVGGVVAAELLSKTMYGQHIWDALTTADEEMAGARKAEAEAVTMSRDEIRERIKVLEKETDAMREYSNILTLLFNFPRWEDIPEEYKAGIFPSSIQIQGGYAEKQEERRQLEYEWGTRTGFSQDKHPGYRGMRSAETLAQPMPEMRWEFKPFIDDLMPAYTDAVKAMIGGSDTLDQYIQDNVETISEEVIALYDLAAALGVNAVGMDAFTISTEGALEVTEQFNASAIDQARLLTSGVGQYATDLEVATEAGREFASSLGQFESLVDIMPASAISSLHDNYLTELGNHYIDTENMDDRSRALSLAAFKADWAERLSVIRETLEEAVSLSRQLEDQAWQPIMGMMGYIGETQAMSLYDNYLAGLTKVYDETEGLDERLRDWRISQYEYTFNEELTLFRSSLDDREQAEKQYLKDREKWYKDAQKGFDKLVTDALKPTAVTAEDVWMTDMGAYEDKWDEPARQMRAALEGSPDWDWMLPEHVKQMDDKGRADWGKQWLDDFYAGMMPDAINWDAFVADFKKNLQREQGRNNLIERAKEELAKQGITATDEDILATLGMESPMQKMYFGGLSPTEAGKQLDKAVTASLEQVSFSKEDVEDPSASLVFHLSDGVEKEWKKVPWSASLAGGFNTDLDTNYGALTDVGSRIGGYIFDGMTEDLASRGFVWKIVDIVLQILDEE